MEIGFWMVLADDTTRPPPRYRHDTYDAAKQEAKRLALRNPGERFFVLAAVGVARTPEPVTFEKTTLRDELSDEIPF